MASKISIIIPVYNGEQYLSEAIDSCLLQTFTDFEIIIVNDCSTDSSLSIAEKFVQQDSRIRIINNEVNKKLPASLNVGHLAAKGTYVTWTSDDNILKPTFLEKLVSELEKQDAALVYSNYDIILDDGKLKRKHVTGPTEQLFFGNVIGASFIYKRTVFKTLGGYNEQLFLLEDFDFWLRASRLFRFIHLNENLYQYRLHAKSLTARIQGGKAHNKKHDKGIELMFSNLAEVCSWHQETKSVLTKHFNRKELEVEKYISNKEIIKKDLFNFNSEHLDSEVILEGLLKVVRSRMVSESKYRSFKKLLLVLKEEPLLLFHRSFSKKVTIKYIKDCIF